MKKYLLSVIILMGAGSLSAQNFMAENNNDPDLSRHEERRLEKAEKTREFCRYMDSLIRTNVYSFRPVSFQVQPSGRNQQILNNSFRMDVHQDYIDIYLPFVRGFMPPYRVSSINYTLTYVPQYTAERSEDGMQWVISFQSNLYSSDTYKFKMTVTTCTGDATLDITSNTNNTISYSGSLSRIY